MGNRMRIFKILILVLQSTPAVVLAGFLIAFTVDKHRVESQAKECFAGLRV